MQKGSSFHENSEPQIKQQDFMQNANTRLHANLKILASYVPLDKTFYGSQKLYIINYSYSYLNEG